MLTVCERSRLKRATLVPLAMHTVPPSYRKKRTSVITHCARHTKKIKGGGGLTVGIFQRLLLFGRLRNDFDPLAVEHADILAVAVEHFHRQHEMFALVRVGDEERLGRAITLFLIQTNQFQFLVLSSKFQRFKNQSINQEKSIILCR